MARARPKDELPPAPEAPPLPPAICGTCQFWIRKHMLTHVGDCQKAFMGTSGYLTTTDQTSCTLHQFK